MAAAAGSSGQIRPFPSWIRPVGGRISAMAARRRPSGRAASAARCGGSISTRRAEPVRVRSRRRRPPSAPPPALVCAPPSAAACASARASARPRSPPPDRGRPLLQPLVCGSPGVRARLGRSPAAAALLRLACGSSPSLPRLISRAARRRVCAAVPSAAGLLPSMAVAASAPPAAAWASVRPLQVCGCVWLLSSCDGKLTGLATSGPNTLLHLGLH